MKRIVYTGGVALILAFLSGQALATDAAALYQAKCASCHGSAGIGTAMAPALVANKFDMNSTSDQIVAVIKNGREGDTKHYSQYAMGMPAQKTMSDMDVDALTAYLKMLAAQPAPLPFGVSAPGRPGMPVQPMMPGMPGMPGISGIPGMPGMPVSPRR